MVITKTDVRKYLNDISSEQLLDATIDVNLDLAKSIVSEEAHSDCTPDLIEKAILTQAGYLSYVAYYSHLERALSTVPLEARTQLDEYRQIADLFLGYARRGESAPAVPHVYRPDSAMTGWFRDVLGDI